MNVTFHSLKMYWADKVYSCFKVYTGYMFNPDNGERMFYGPIVGLITVG